MNFLFKKCYLFLSIKTVALLLSSLVTSTHSMAQITSELIDPYSMTVGDIKLFGSIDEYLAEFGLPDQVIQKKRLIQINTSEELKKLLKKTTSNMITELQFEGIGVWAFSNYEIIPVKIDLRKANVVIGYNDKVFDQHYSIDNIETDFPQTLRNQPLSPTSLFSLSTGETTESIISKTLFRKTKDNPEMTPIVEFTFKENRLIYIFFANF